MLATASSELYVPARTLPYGLYELQLTVAMVNRPSLLTVASVFVRITPSKVAANLLQYGTSMIIHGSQQDLQLDPGNYSIDRDEENFNASVR